MKLLPLLTVSILLLSACTNADQVNSRENNSISFKESPEAIVAKMTLEEKVGQLFMIGFYGPKPDYYLNKMIRKRNIGGVILMKYNLEGKEQTINLIKEIQDSAKSIYPPIPLFLSVDQEGGIVSRVKFFRQKLELTAQKDIINDSQAFAVAYRRGTELKELGIHINYSPVVEHITDPNSFLYQRVFRSENNIATATLAGNMVEGYTEAGIIAVPKHFPGHTNNSIDSHGELPVEDIDQEAFNTLLSSFETVLEKNPDMIMTSHVMYPQLDSVYPATLSKNIMNYLRNDLHFNGLIISDDMEMKAIEKNYTLEKSSVMALNAGVDILLFSSTPQKQADAYNAVVNAIKNGELDEALIDEKVKKIVALKQKFIKTSSND